MFISYNIYELIIKWDVTLMDGKEKPPVVVYIYICMVDSNLRLTY